MLFALMGSCFVLSDCSHRKPAPPTPAPPVKLKGLKMSPYTVRGVRYRPMNVQQALEYTETGEASFYGQQGTRGACGEILSGLYAAHRTLPLPCTARVTSVRTGKSCIVRVIDRGPFHKRRIIDLSRSAGRALGMNPYSIGQVKVEVISVGKGKNIIHRR